MAKPKLKQYKEILKVENFNKGPGFLNVNLLTDKDKIINIKLEPKKSYNLEIGNLYEITYKEKLKEANGELIKVLISYEPVSKKYSGDEVIKIYSKFYNFAPLPIIELKNYIEKQLSSLKNKVIKNITTTIYDEYKDKFYTHPAAKSYHHAYFGGLAYHTYTMLHLVEPFCNTYTYLSKDLLTAGVILHDICKIDEITRVDGEYTKEGVLLGHLTMGAIKVELTAKTLGYIDEEETLLLKHMILSHHGLPYYGSPQKPQIPEAYILWIIDTVDSKFSVLKDEYKNTKTGEFTSNINVLDKLKYYKHKLIKDK